jgi:hypothetical protein
MTLGNRSFLWVPLQQPWRITIEQGPHDLDGNVSIIPEKYGHAVITPEKFSGKNNLHEKRQNYGEEKSYFFLGAAFFFAAFFGSGFFAAAFFAAAMWFPPPTGKGYIFSQSVN